MPRRLGFVGPEHAWLRDLSRAEYLRASGAEARKGAHLLAETEGIIPALESAHAVGKLHAIAQTVPEGGIILNVCGRGDKDVAEIARVEGFAV